VEFPSSRLFPEALRLRPPHPISAVVLSRRFGSALNRRGLTLVEVMVSFAVLAAVMLGFISAIVQSRRITESSVLQSAATSMVYGLIEQMKSLDYTTLMPSYAVDPFSPTAIQTASPYIPVVRLRIHQDLTVWLRVRHTTSDGTPKAPATCPAASAAASSVGSSPGALDNYTGSIPMSTVTGTTSQSLNLNIWVWIDEIPDSTKDVSDAKRVTVVYTYSYLDGAVTKTVRDMEVFIRTRYDQ
jgi:hypothetical protein